MDENKENVQEQVPPEGAAQQLADCAGKLSAAAEAMQAVLEKLEAQYESLNQKVDRIVAAIEENALHAAAAAERKTLPSTVTMLLAKSGMEPETAIEAGALDKALQALSVEQRIAVKAEMARAGMLAE